MHPHPPSPRIAPMSSIEPKKIFNACFSKELLLLVLFIALGSPSLIAQELWVYSQTNLLVPEEVERIETLMRRAKLAGYTHILVADSKFSRLAQLDQRYFNHVERIKKLAAELPMKLVPAVCSVGYSNDILSLNPNLAEGLPVREALYVVRSGIAHHVPDSSSTDSNNALPSLREKRQWGFIDEALVPDGDALRSVRPHTGNVRVSKKIELTPFRQYHVSVEIQTEDLDVPVEIKLLTKDGSSLNYTNLGVQPTQDWKTHHITFNSLGNEQATLYIGAWGLTQGQLSIRNPMLHECGAVNLVRRPTAPIEVLLEGPDGRRTMLSEGVDFQPWSDPKLGTVPYGGEYEVWHEAPPLKLLRNLPDASRLRVSYFHTHVVYDGQVCGTASDKDFQQLLDQQIDAMTRLFPEADFMMSHDEYRVMGWTKSNIDRLAPDASPAAVLSHNVKHCSEQLSGKAPASRIAVWSDMFDPYHNARDKYYLVNGSLRDAQAPESVRIVNWNFDKRQESLKHFSKKGHSQILAGYYDGPPEQINRWLDTVLEQQIPNVQGVMYTTWRRNYSDLETFAKKVQSHRWHSEPR